MLQALRHLRARRDFREIAGSATLGARVSMGPWTKVGPEAVIGDDVILGPWAEIGRRARIGDHAEIGKWVRVGDLATVPVASRIPGHVRIQPGVDVTADLMLEGHELITHAGIIRRRCCAYSCGQDDPTGPVRVVGIFGHYEVPAADFDDEMIQDYMWGASEELERYRIEVPEVAPDEIFM